MEPTQVSLYSTINANYLNPQQLHSQWRGVRSTLVVTFRPGRAPLKWRDLGADFCRLKILTLVAWIKDCASPTKADFDIYKAATST